MGDINSQIPSKMKLVFAMFMVVIYVGMGILMLINFFDFRSDWDIIRYCMGGIFIVYGIYRAYREFKK